MDTDAETSPQSGITRFARSLYQLDAAMLTLLGLAACYVARSFLLPVVAAALLSYALIPAVRFLIRIHITRILASLVVVLAFCAFIGLAILLLASPTLDLLKETPSKLKKVERYIGTFEKRLSAVSEASEQIDRMTGSEKNGGVVVTIKEDSLTEIVFSQTPIFIGGVVSTILLMFFLLAFGDAMLRATVEAAPRLDEKRRFVEIARTLESSVSRYIITVTVINVCLGIAVGGLLFMLGFENPILWGVIATGLNYVPYLGALVGVALLTLASIGSAASMPDALIYPAVYLACTVTEGNFITPIVLGRSFSVNPIFIILALLFLGWLWGLPGAVMAVPLLIAIKALCETTERGQRFAALLRRS